MLAIEKNVAKKLFKSTGQQEKKVMLGVGS